MAGTKKHSATKRRSTKTATPSGRAATKRKAISAVPMREGRLSKMSVAKAIEIAQRAGIIDAEGNLRPAYKHR